MLVSLAQLLVCQLLCEIFTRVLNLAIPGPVGGGVIGKFFVAIFFLEMELYRYSGGV